jgi:hypothetical protein
MDGEQQFSDFQHHPEPRTGNGVNPLKSKSYRAGLEVTWKRVILCPEFRDFRYSSTILFSCIIK